MKERGSAQSLYQRLIWEGEAIFCPPALTELPGDCICVSGLSWDHQKNHSSEYGHRIWEILNLSLILQCLERFFMQQYIISTWKQWYYKNNLKHAALALKPGSRQRLENGKKTIEGRRKNYLCMCHVMLEFFKMYFQLFVMHSEGDKAELKIKTPVICVCVLISYLKGHVDTYPHPLQH